MLNDIEKARVVISAAGRDKGHKFFVVEADEQYVYLADGRTRKVERPKKKKLKHICKTGLDGGSTAEKLRSGEAVSNKELRLALEALEPTV